MMWLEIEIDARGGEFWVTARGSRGERPSPHKMKLEGGVETLTAFTQRVGRAVRAGRGFDTSLIDMGRTIHDAVFQGELRDVLARMTDRVRAGGDAREHCVLIRMFLQDRTLLAVPWEALCHQPVHAGFLGTDPHLRVTRGVSSADPWAPREVRDAIRVLVVAPGNEQAAVDSLRQTLQSSITAGEIEWLEPIAGPDVNARFLFERLRREKTPHIFHFIGHGSVDSEGRPSLRLVDDTDGEEVWLGVDALARELALHFSEELRLVLLEACEGARPGAMGCAADQLARAGADAVVGHLWPTRAEAARICSAEIYKSLTGAQTNGDIATSVAAARRSLLAQSAEAFSPVLFLRGPDSVLFDVSRRKVAPSAELSAHTSLAPALYTLLHRPPFTLVVGDIDEDRALLRKELLQFLDENGDNPNPQQPLSALTQRCLLRFGDEVLQSLFQQAISGTLRNDLPPLISALGALAPPGVHVTLLWRPYLERAIAAEQPQKNIYALQISTTDPRSRPRLIKRAAGASTWKMEPMLPKGFDLESDIVVLRMYGGYSPEPRPIYSQPVVTEDDHIHGLFSTRPPQWLDELLSIPRTQPAMLLGLSALDWRHRLFLRWLYDERPAPEDSLVILSPDTDSNEPEIWDNGGGLPGAARLVAMQEEPHELSAKLRAFLGARAS